MTNKIKGLEAYCYKCNKIMPVKFIRHIYSKQEIDFVLQCNKCCNEIHIIESRKSERGLKSKWEK